MAKIINKIHAIRVQALCGEIKPVLPPDSALHDPHNAGTPGLLLIHRPDAHHWRGVNPCTATGSTRRLFLRMPWRPSTPHCILHELCYNFRP